MSIVSQIDVGLSSLKELIPLFNFEAKERGENWIYELVLHSNSIRQLDVSVLGLIVNVRILDLSSNYLSSLTGIAVLQGLEELNLSNNKISKIQGLWKLKRLWNLNLSFNRISSLETIGIFIIFYFS